MAEPARKSPEDDIEATAQQPVKDENAPADRDRSSFSDVAESAPQLPKDDIETAAQQPVQDENAPADGGKSSHSDELPELTYERLLYKFVSTSKDYRIANAFLNFDNLSRVNVMHLMNELAKYEEAMRKNKAAPQDIEQLGDLLHRYTTAVQDRRYWSKSSKPGHIMGSVVLLLQSFPEIYGGFPVSELVFLGESSELKSGSIDPLRNFLRRVLPRSLTWSYKEVQRRDFNDYLEDQAPQEISPFVDTLARFIVAITGGLSLVIPMLVMRLGETLPKSLTTVSVAVVLFSALTSLMFKASNVETLAATAAYAAVLVVFVGTSG